MSDLFACDSRLVSKDFLVLPGSYGNGDDKLQVGSGTRLSMFISMVEAAARRRGPFRKMIIAAHGENHRLGWGMQFCEEGLNEDTISRLHVFRGKVHHFKLLGCRMANVENGGDRCCRLLATTTGAFVTASEDIQELTSHSFDHWEGSVVTFNPNGAVVEHRRRTFPLDPDRTGQNNHRVAYPPLP